MIGVQVDGRGSASASGNVIPGSLPMDSYSHTGPDGQRSALARCRSCIFFADQVPDPTAPGRPLSGRCHAAPPTRDTSGWPFSHVAARIGQSLGTGLFIVALLDRSDVFWRTDFGSLAALLFIFIFAATAFFWLRELDELRARPVGIFPIVSADQWCGRWTMRPAAPDVADEASPAVRIVRAR